MGYWPSVRSRWLDIGQVLFLRVYGPRGLEIHKHAKEERAQYPAIFIEQAFAKNELLIYEKDFGTCCQEMKYQKHSTVQRGSDR